ncbi:MAG: radical SAM family heme chaperone HemW [Clostridia bacterium]
MPFCVRKCAYCSFVSFPAAAEEKDAYVASLLREAELRQSEADGPVETVYIGGGTPSLLSPSQLRRLIAGLREYYEIRPDAELSMESNPGTLTAAFLDTAVSAGVNRLSLGMQAYQPEILQFLGRIHSFEEVSRSVSMARAAGLNNLNLDLIFGIPGQTLSDWDETLDAALSLSPDHLSAYGLIPEEGTPLQRRLENGEAVLPDPDLEREMYDLAIRKLRAADLEQYEISNFARKGYECRHNIGYWTQVPYLGLGLAAASMRILEQQTGLGLTCLLTTNPSDPTTYQEMIRSGNHSAAIRETISPEEARFETMMLSLRMNRGISESRFLALHGVSIDAVYGEKLEEMRKKGLMRHENGAWSLTRKGMDIQNTVLVELM